MQKIKERLSNDCNPIFVFTIIVLDISVCLNFINCESGNVLYGHIA